ncbi:GNAT family N-acetyltransferase [Agromyces protaetiae]|uniref:GNAT family N-acetyltransferase n=1 Tax=Agromyces protaetiae TaxID=2509455 RepID=A0A4P6FEC5_9MICO|nr:GNAT family N-acetyltransferase [Agromyces protaetiae]QAY74265.1 GNAT family N-acetyltransferase [Agromyces protaetiae]
MTSAGIETGSPVLRVVSAADVPFADVAAVFGTRGDAAGCWCQWYKIPGSDWRSVGVDSLRDRLASQLAEGGRAAQSGREQGPGLLAYLGDTPVGWCAVEPRPGLPRLRGSRIVTTGTRHPDLDDAAIWAVTCFVVPRAHRRKGVGSALARAAVEYAREGGARALEAYAVDATTGTKRAADLFHGAISMFEAAGFTEVARTSPTRAVMQIEFG